jgi:glycosyltransferase involved in cell wall biosynthesis
VPLVTISTATHPDHAGFLTSTAEAVAALTPPSGWEIEWVVQEDGPVSDLAERLSSDRFAVRYAANGVRLGIAATRNLALSRAAGHLIQNLDADDVLLTLLVEIFDDPSIHWAIGQADDLLPDGTRRRYPPDLPFGRVPAGAVNAWAGLNGNNWPIHCAGLLMRTDSVRAVGGWGAAPVDDDIIMFAALSQVADGWFDPTSTWLYRHHDGQHVRSDAWRSWGATGRSIALQRAQALRAAGIRLAEPVMPESVTLLDYLRAEPLVDDGLEVDSRKDLPDGSGLDPAPGALG